MKNNKEGLWNSQEVFYTTTKENVLCCSVLYCVIVNLFHIMIHQEFILL